MQFREQDELDISSRLASKPCFAELSSSQRHGCFVAAKQTLTINKRRMRWSNEPGSPAIRAPFRSNTRERSYPCEVQNAEFKRSENHTSIVLQPKEAADHRDYNSRRWDGG